ncbi:MAG: nucleoside 2-deoxyribosyltransferase domain-containing protein [Chitinophagaceae bacterium]|nr:nucleoside 2-deoxyribosyltransferase domain-containing protein [Chitinophagaceae bacterium]MCZ2395764.1 nucleoside 2-deoxyribosyltransferase domain-containing protein [Chitinophagales bacterium]
MKLFYLLLCLTLLSTATQAQKAAIIKSPAALPVNTTRLKIFLGGSIDMGNAEDWQHTVETRLSDEDVVLLNPRRDDWNKEWKPISTDTHFRNQVEWELNALEKADIIIMFLAPGSQSPVSLLELGLYARTHKLMVVCPEGFWRKGNVDIVCEKYGIETYSDLHKLLEALKEKIRKHHG